jgi:uncharacterized protein DUF262
VNYGITLKSPPRFGDIPPLTRHATWAVDVSWSYLKGHIDNHSQSFAIDFEPDFQRGHVWSPHKQVAFVEFMLRGGDSARNLYFNCPGWQRLSNVGPYVIVDGKQRLTAALAFLDDKVPVFGGHLFSHFKDGMRLVRPSFRWHVNDLETRAEVLQWYLDLNTGGVVHTADEIDKVKQLLKKERGETVDEVVQRGEDDMEMVVCGSYGCTQLKRKNDVFCRDCAEEYGEDPDAFK